MTNLRYQEPQVCIATYLMCTDHDVLRIYNALPFTSENEKSDMQVVLCLVEKHYLGETNLIYERFKLNQRVQDKVETFDRIYDCPKRMGQNL